MVPVAAIVQRLRDDATFAALATGGIYDDDPRRETNDYTPPFDDDGYVIPYAAADDTGGGSSPFGPAAFFREYVFVWLFAPGDNAGRTRVRQMAERVIQLLLGWHDPATGTRLGQVERLGAEQIPAAIGAARERLRFQVTGIYAGVDI